MGERLEEADEARFVRALESLTGKKFNEEERRSLIHGADELDIVNSGLEETMVSSYQAIRETLRQAPHLADLRAAAFRTAIDRIGVSYLELGVYP